MRTHCVNLLGSIIIMSVGGFAAAGGNNSVDPPNPRLSMADDRTAMELGRKVLAVKQAIQNPRRPKSMQAVTELGRDQRYYVMVRGWLSYQLDGDRSIYAAAKGQTHDEVRQRIQFLEKAIRAIDLE